MLTAIGSYGPLWRLTSVDEYGDQDDDADATMVLGGVIMNRITVLSFAVLSALFAAILYAQVPAYRITHTYNVGGDGRWDYVVPDPPNHRVFIGRTNRVMVVDEDSGKLLGGVTGINGEHGTALA